MSNDERKDEAQNIRGLPERTLRRPFVVSHGVQAGNVVEDAQQILEHPRVVLA